jgi:hypothetical protein
MRPGDLIEPYAQVPAAKRATAPSTPEQRPAVPPGKGQAGSRLVAVTTSSTPCRHEPRRAAGRHCPDCRREAVIDHVAAAGVKLPQQVVADAVDAVMADRPATLRTLAAALIAYPRALTVGVRSYSS